MTRYIVVIHKMVGTARDLAGLLARIMEVTGKRRIMELCSGGGGSMKNVAAELKEKHNLQDISIFQSDLFPNLAEAKRINSGNDANFRYLLNPVDATSVPKGNEGIRTLVCSMHHMNPETAMRILKSAMDDREPVCVFEISDNSSPKALWWLAIPFNFLSVFFITPMVRPMTIQQIFFTYIIPVLPLFIAWDGAVSNARTYSQSDWDEILRRLPANDYQWERGIVRNKVRKSYMIGIPGK